MRRSRPCPAHWRCRESAKLPAPSAPRDSPVNILSLFKRKPAAPRRAAAAASQVRPRGNGDGRQPQRVAYLAAHGVEKSFGGRKVVKGVTIYVRRGEAVGLLGPNGAGKTTVFYMITGLIKADRGRIELDGYDITACRCTSARASASAICRRKPRSSAA